MRWDALFADLEAELGEDAAEERRLEVAERMRAEFGRLRLVDRLQPALGAAGPLRIGLRGHPAVSGALTGLGADWMLIEEQGGESLIALAAVQLIQGLTGASAEPGWEGRVGSRLDLRVALRRLVRDRSVVTVGLTGGDALGSVRLARVGSDHVELIRVDPLGRASGQGWTVPLSAVAFVRRR
jgi:hypothetical protein